MGKLHNLRLLIFFLLLLVVVGLLVISNYYPSPSISHKLPVSYPYSYWEYPNCRFNAKCCEKFRPDKEWPYDSFRTTFTYEYRHELFLYLMWIECQFPFAISRYGDGEYAVAFGFSYKSDPIDRWSYDKDNTFVSDLLKSVLREVTPFFFHALPCPANYKKYVEMFHKQMDSKSDYAPIQYLTYSTLFTDSNYPFWKKWFSQTIIQQKKLKVKLIINEECRKYESKILSWANQIHYVPDDLVKKFQDLDIAEFHLNQALKLSEESGYLILVSSGPLAAVFIHKMWKNNPKNIYLDVGSSLDEFVKFNRTRAYHNSDDFQSWLYCPQWGITRKHSKWILKVESFIEKDCPEPFDRFPCRANQTGWIPPGFSKSTEFASVKEN